MNDSAPSNTPCPHASGCPLHPLFTVRTFLQTWIALYCEADYSRCERYRRRLSGSPIASTLLPNGRDLTDYSPAKKAP